MRCSKRRRWKHIPFRIIPEMGQVPENSVEPSVTEDGDVLHDDVSGLKTANEVCIFAPQPATGSIKSRRLPSRRGLGKILTGKSPCQYVNRCGIGRDMANVVIHRTGPVLLQHGSAKQIGFHLPCNFHASGFQTDINSTDPTEQAPDL